MEKTVVKQQSTSLAFVENATQSIENMMQYANTLLESGLCPAHFYEKDQKNKPDFSKGKPAAVVMVLQYGMECGLSPMQSLQQVVPVNNLISIKGDGAKMLIFRSGALEPGSWKETVSGSIEGEDYEVSITAKRKDNGLIMTRSFSVDKAKRAGLWIDQSKLSGQDGWKHKLSAWYKYPERMISYRALGFLARDLFGDVLNGAYTTEEAIDMPADETYAIPTSSGAKIEIPSRNFNEERSQKLTSRAVEKIDKQNHIEEKQSEEPQVEGVDPEVAEPEFETEEKTLENLFGELTEEYMKENFETSDLLEFVQKNDDMAKALEVLPGKNTHAKLRGIIFSYQSDNLDDLVAKYKEDDTQDKENQDNPEPENTPEESSSEDIQPDKSFDENPNEAHLTNKFNIKVPELPEEGGKRSFERVKLLFEQLTDAGLTNERFIEIKNSVPVFKHYSSKEDVCFSATARAINMLFNLI